MKKNNIHYNYFVVDGHNDTMAKVVDKNTWLPIIDIGKQTDFHIDIPKLEEGGLNVAFFASFTPGYYGNNSKSLSRNLALINALYYTAKQNSDTFQITTTVDDIYKAIENKRIAAVPTIEGAYAIDEMNYKELLKQFYDLGIRVIAPTWNYSNAIGEGCNRIYGDDKNTPSNGGLTKLGERVIEEMNKLGILIDVSHLSEETFWDIINITKSPVIASHSGVYSLKNHQRNLKDYQLEAIKQNGGVVAVVLFTNFLSDKDDVYIKDFVNHIDYIVNFIGIDYVGIGSDFDGAQMPTDLKDASQMYKITDELINRGYSESDIEKVLGKNILRVLSKAQENGIYKPNTIKVNIKYSDENIIINFEDGELDIHNSKVIIDGLEFKTINIDTETLIIYCDIKELSYERFHVITFEDDFGRYTEIANIGGFKKIL